MNPGVIYTCVTGDYDLLKDHSYVDPNWDYVCYTDNTNILNKSFRSWKIKELKFNNLDNTRNNRWHKIHPHLLFPKYEYSMYLDANIDVLSSSFTNSVKKSISGNCLMTLPKHTERSSTFDECEACIKLKKDDRITINKQRALMENDNYPGIYAFFSDNSIIYRKHNNPKVTEIMDQWWWWIENYSRRDQLSLNYVLWKNKFPIMKLSEKNYRENNNEIKYWFHTEDMRDQNIKLNEDIEILKQKIISLSKENELINAKLNEYTQSRYYRLRVFLYRIFNRIGYQ